MGIETAIIAAAVIAGGSAIVSSAMAPSPPSIPPPPPPASYYSYDESGNPAGEQVWDAEKNAYVYKPAPLTEEQKAEKAKRDELRSKMLTNLDQAPEDRVQAYDEYAKAFSDTMHKDVDQRYKDVVRSTDESMNARGMTGSRAYADTVSNLARDKQATDVDIAQRATLAKEDLAAQDRNYWLTVLNSLDSGARADTALAIEKSGLASNAAAQGTSGIMAAYGADSLNQMRKWEGQMQQNANLTNNLMDTSSGLAFLYGYDKRTNVLSPKKSTGIMV